MKPFIQNKKDIVFYNENIVTKVKNLAKKTNNKRARYTNLWHKQTR